MDLSERAKVLNRRLSAFDAVLDLEDLNFHFLENLATKTIEADDVVPLIDRRKKWQMDLIHRQFRVSIFNYVSAAVAVVNQSKRGSSESSKGVVQLFRIKEAEDEIFDYVTNNFIKDDEHGLVLEIRNACTHRQLPNHTIWFDVGAGKAKLTIPTQFLLDVVAVRSSVRRYVSNLGDEIELLPLIRAHHDKIIALNQWVKKAVIKLWAEEIEYLEARRQTEYGRALKHFVAELESALGAEGDDKFIDHLHFTLSGPLSTIEQIQLILLQSNMKKWAEEAYDLVANKVTIPTELDETIRKRLSDCKDT